MLLVSDAVDRKVAKTVAADLVVLCGPVVHLTPPGNIAPPWSRWTSSTTRSPDIDFFGS